VIAKLHIIIRRWSRSASKPERSLGESINDLRTRLAIETFEDRTFIKDYSVKSFKVKVIYHFVVCDRDTLFDLIV
jgi:hypothetical protein